MKKQRTMGNKGFSLVELIIVIAIMAILIGVMAPNLLRYVEQTRVSADKQVADTVRTAIITAMLDPSVKSNDLPTVGDPAADITTIVTSNSFGSLVEDTLGCTPAAAAAKLKSKGYKGQPIKFEVTGKSEVVVTIAPATGSGVTETIKVPEDNT